MFRWYKLSSIIVIVAFLFTTGLYNSSYAENDPRARSLAEEIARHKRLEQEEIEILVKERTQRGIESYQEANYGEAIRQLMAALELNPQDKEAEKYLNLALSSLLDSAQSHYTKGVEYYKKGNFAKAIDELNQIPESNRYHEEAQEYIKAARKTLETAGVPKPSSPGFEKKDVKRDLKTLDKEQEIVVLKKELQEKRMMIDVDRAYLPPERLEEKRVEAVETAEEIAERKREEERLRLIEKMNENIVPALSLTDANIQDVIRELMKITGVTIVLDERALERVAGGRSVRVSFTTVSPLPLLDLIEIILKTTELSYKVESNYIWISDRQTLAKEELITRTYRLQHGVRRTREVSLMEF
jgi:tetratricopeptide (TPR) repeat protein